jgi:predicted secreted protein
LKAVHRDHEMEDKKERARLIEQARRYLESAGRPRLVMLGVLSVTLAAGFLASVAMVHLGVVQMHIRYPLAVAVAYATFLWQLRCWLRRQPLVSQLSEDPEGLLVPGAAAFGAAALGDKLAAEEGRQRRSPTGSSGVGDFSGIGDIGEGVGALVILVLIAGITTLLTELLVDGALLGAMSRAVSPDHPPHWSRAVVRRTWIAALVTAVVFGLVGFGIERIAPGARTLAEAWAIDNGR